MPYEITWMMYHWQVSALAAEAAIILYDGAPILKAEGGLDCSRLWSLAEAAGTTHLGISPKYLATVAAEGYNPGTEADLSSLRSLLANASAMSSALGPSPVSDSGRSRRDLR